MLKSFKIMLILIKTLEKHMKSLEINNKFFQFNKSSEKF